MIHGTITYKDNSQGNFSFKNLKSLLEMLEKEDFKEVNIYRDLEGKPLKDKIKDIIKKADEQDGGIFKEDIIKQLKENPEEIQKEINNLLEQGVIYEPKINKFRWLG